MVYPSVLSHLIRLDPHPEDLATEALAHVLRNSVTARAALNWILAQAGVALPDNLSFRTQQSGEDKSRPDLTGFDANNREVLHIEAKFDAGLTDNQPVAYLKRLPSDSPGMVLFIVPDRRREFLWSELLRKIELPASPPPGPVAKIPYGPHFLGISSWKYVLGALRSNLDAAGDVGAASDIRQLESACERIDEEAFRPLAAEELGPAVPRRVLQLLALLSDIGTRMQSRTGLVASGRSSGAWGTGQDAYAYFQLPLSVGGAPVGLSLSFELWAKGHETPIWLQIYQAEQQKHLREKLADLESSSPPGVVFQFNNAYIPIRLPTKADREEVLTEMVKQVLDISGRFAAV